MSQRRAVTVEMARRYWAASRRGKAAMLDELCALTGWHRDHARKALRQAGVRRLVPCPRRPRPVVHGEEVVSALRVVWAVMDAPAGKRLAPFLPEMVTRLRACGELLIDRTAALLTSMSAATIDRRLTRRPEEDAAQGTVGNQAGVAAEVADPDPHLGDWDDARPGFVEIDLVGHEGGEPSGDFCHTLDVTDVATGWTEVRAVKNKAQRWVFAALLEITAAFPFPVRGIDSDNGSEFINNQLLRYCEQNKITFTRSRAGRKNGGAYVEQKNWSVVRQTVGYHRYDTAAELALLNQIYALLRLTINFFTPQQKLISKHREGAKMIKRYDTAKTPYQRVLADPRISQKIKDGLTRQYGQLNPAQLRRDILTLSDRLLKTTRANHQPGRRQVPPSTPMRAPASEATKNGKRAS